jgi:hypothetical protein
MRAGQTSYYQNINPTADENAQVSKRWHRQQLANKIWGQEIKTEVHLPLSAYAGVSLHDGCLLLFATNAEHS